MRKHANGRHIATSSIATRLGALKLPDSPSGGRGRVSSGDSDTISVKPPVGTPARARASTDPAALVNREASDIASPRSPPPPPKRTLPVSGPKNQYISAPSVL